MQAVLLHKVLENLIVSLYPLWVLTWTGVAVAYGKAARVSWVEEGGQWRYVLRDLARPFWRTLLGRDDIFTYSSGHILRWSIFIGSFTPITWGLTFIFVDRGHYTYTYLVANVVGLLLSLLAAIGHLSLVYRSRTAVWTRYIWASVVWLVLSTVFLTGQLPAAGVAHYFQ